VTEVPGDRRDLKRVFWLLAREQPVFFSVRMLFFIEQAVFLIKRNGLFWERKRGVLEKNFSTRDKNVGLSYV
jgi:hypothetical protein